MNVLVLTGATVAFPELLNAFDDDLFDKLEELGYKNFSFQYGFAQREFNQLLARRNRPEIGGFSRVTDITPHIKEADLVIAPAGAGSILDVLRSRSQPPKLVVCVNSSLLDNHQTEIARALEPRHLIMCDPSTVAQAVARAATEDPLPLPAPQSLQQILDSVLGQ